MGTRSAGRSARCMSVWASVPEAPLDPILGMSQRHAADTDPRKVNVSIGAYRTDEGKPLVLNCVKKAEKMMLEDHIEQGVSATARRCGLCTALPENDFWSGLQASQGWSSGNCA